MTKPRPTAPKLAALTAILVVTGWFWATPLAVAGVGVGIGDGLGDPIGDAVGGATGTVTDTTDSVGNTVNDTTGVAVDTVTGTVTDTTDSVGNTVNDTTGGATGGGDGGLLPDPGTVTGGLDDGAGTGSTQGSSGPSGSNVVPGWNTGSAGTDAVQADGSETSPGGRSHTAFTLSDGSPIKIPLLADGTVDGRKVLGSAPPGRMSPEEAAVRGLLTALAVFDLGSDPGPVSSSEPESTSFFSDAARAATQAAKKLAFPMALAAIVGLFVVGYGRVGRKDPKLLMAPVDSEEQTFTFH